MTDQNIIGRFSKDEEESFTVEVDFADWLATGDAVSTHAVTAYQGESDVSGTLIGSTADDNVSKVTFVVQAGTEGLEYRIEVKATTSDSEVWVAKLMMTVN